MTFINGKEVLFMAPGGMATVVVPGTSDTDLGTPGIVYMADERSGLRLDDLQRLSIASASITDVDKRLSETKPIVPARLDYAIKSGLTANTETWTDDTTDENGEVVKGDKTKARELIGAVGFNDIVTKDGDNFGLVRLKPWGMGGFTLDPDGRLALQNPSDSLILNRVSTHAITPSELDKSIYYAIAGKKAIWNGSAYIPSYGNQIPLTDEEKGYAQRWLGLYNDSSIKEYAWDNDATVGWGPGDASFKTYSLVTTDTLSLDKLGSYYVDIDVRTFDINTETESLKTVTVDLTEFTVTELSGAYLLTYTVPNVYLKANLLIITDYNALNATDTMYSFSSKGVWLADMATEASDSSGTWHSIYTWIKVLHERIPEVIPDRFLDLENRSEIKKLKQDAYSYNNLSDKPFYIVDTVDISRGSSDVYVDLLSGGTTSEYARAYLCSENTYSPDQLRGAKVECFDCGNTIYSTLGEPTEVTSNGITYQLGYLPLYVFVAYNSNYHPSIAANPFPKAGIYFGSTFTMDYEVISVQGIKIPKTLDNVYLDLANNAVIKALVARIEELESKLNS